MLENARIEHRRKNENVCRKDRVEKQMPTN